MASEIYDFAVIGGGPVGLYIAKNLNPNLKIIVIEAGGENPSPKNISIQNLTSGSRIVSPITAFGLGGGMNLWGGRLVNYQPRDFNEEKYDYGRLKLNHYYKKVGEEFDIKELRSEYKINDDLSVEEHYVYNKPDFLNSLKKTVMERVKIVKYRKVINIKKLDYFILRLNVGAEIIARNVIVACGSLEAHRLLYQSQFVSKHIKYGTHPKVTIGEVRIPSAVMEVLKARKGVEKGLVFDNIDKEFNIRVYSQFNLAPVDYLLNQMVPKNKLLIYMYENIYFLKLARKIFMFTNQRLFGNDKRYKIRIFFDQNEDDIILFDTEKLIVEQEAKLLQKLKTIIPLIHETLRKNGFKNLNIYSLDMIEKNVQYAHSHFTGGMSNICDEYGKITSVDGLYICTASLLPYRGYANPTFTLLALARRLSDYLNTQTGCEIHDA